MSKSPAEEGMWIDQVCINQADKQENTFVEQVIRNGMIHPVNTSTIRCVTWPNGTQAAY
jgi:hypothetical protein